MSKRVLLLANLGSPDSPEVKDVRRYLNEFLMDEKVIDIPWLARLLLVKGIIVPFRAPESAKKYKSIWTANGSPLIHITQELAKSVHAYSQMPVYVCMRYANPTPQQALQQIMQNHPDCAEVILFPLYPHYAMSSYQTAVEHVQEAWKKMKCRFELEVVKPYYKHPAYLQALASSIKPYLDQNYDHILFSYHGVPERHITKTDPTGNHCLKGQGCCNTASPAHDFCYRHQIMESTRLTAQMLGLRDGSWSFAFQSRLGKDKWLQPYTAAQLAEFPKQGVKKLLVVSPAFVSDCLETLEEIHEEGKEIFLHAGGHSFTTVPCLNTNQEWVAAIHKLVNEI